MLRLLKARDGSCRRFGGQREVCCRQGSITASGWSNSGPASWHALWNPTAIVRPAPHTPKLKAHNSNCTPVGQD